MAAHNRIKIIRAYHDSRTEDSRPSLPISSHKFPEPRESAKPSTQTEKFLARYPNYRHSDKTDSLNPENYKQGEESK